LVLVVDDAAADAAELAGHLGREGYATVVASSGAEALRLAEQLRPFAITLDVFMPGLDGWEVLLSLKRSPATAAIPVIIVSVSEDRATGLALGAVGLVPKPVDPEVLFSEFRRLAGSASPLVLSSSEREQHLGRVAVMVEKSRLTDGESPDRRPVASPAPVSALRPRPASPVRPVGHVPTVLAVEDNADNMTTLRAVLGGRWRMLEARDGEEGYDLAVRHLPDLVLLDMSLPKLDGLGVLAKLRAHPAAGGLRVVALTALAMKGDRERIIAAGCDDYLSKPIEVDRLLEVVVRWMGEPGAEKAISPT
jgi:CheY-like chemotaxis protein